MSLRILCLTALATFPLPDTVSGATLDVPSQYSTIQAAVDSATAGDTVLVACGTYHEHDIVMKSGVCLRSATRQASCVTIDAEQQGRVLFFEHVDGTAIVEGVTIRGGFTTFSSTPSYVGAGVYCGDASPVFLDCVLISNSAGGTYGSGGGLGCEGTSCPRVEGCVFSRNSAVNGGGIACFHESCPHFLGCTFSENQVGDPCGGTGGGAFVSGGSPTFIGCGFVENVNGWGSGGGLACEGGAVVLASCTFLRNGDPVGLGRTWWGGGLSLVAASAIVNDCVFSENRAAQGAGIDCQGSSGVLTGCTVSGNIVSGEGWLQCGGGLCCQSSQVTVENSSFVNDSAPVGGEICCGDGSTLLLRNTILAFALDGESLICYQGNCDVDLTCCDIFGNAGGDWVGCISDQHGDNGNFSADPLFCDLECGDLRIECGSPCAPGNHPDGYPCGLIGAADVGCEGSWVRRTSWGCVKKMYR